MKMLEPFVGEILETPAEPRGGREIGRSREGRPIHGWRFGAGPAAVSLIAGCHADEPVGPELLRRLCAWLGGLPEAHPLLAAWRWAIVPHANPDGERRNAAWSGTTRPLPDHRGSPDRGFDLAAYLDGAVRELPGDDVEFGFPAVSGAAEAADPEAGDPRTGDTETGDTETGDVKTGHTGPRPENRAVAGFLAAAAPYRVHASLHGMAFAPGVWFLLEEAWEERTAALRQALTARARDMGYPLLDVDRRGEKGFRRIAEGFSTRPDSRAMKAFFNARGEPATAALFRPSSMELVRSLGGDPLTVVSEMPLFLLAPETRGGPPFRPGTEGGRRLRRWLERQVAETAGAPGQLAGRGVRPMPIGDQMRLQLALIDRALAAANG